MRFYAKLFANSFILRRRRDPKSERMNDFLTLYVECSRLPVTFHPGA